MGYILAFFTRLLAYDQVDSVKLVIDTYAVHYDRKGTYGVRTEFGVKGHVGVTKVNDIYCVKFLKQGQMEKLNRSSL